MNLTKAIHFTLICSSALYLSPAKAELNSADIIQNSLSLSCIDWQPTGVCFWLKCRALPPSCSVETSLKVRHFNPDAIVQVYQTPGKTPWKEMSFLSGAAKLGQSAITPSATHQKAGVKGDSAKPKRPNAKIISRHVDIIGSPGLLPVSELIGSMEYGCESDVTPFMPHYISTVDYFSWRFPYSDFLKLGTFIPGMNEVGERIDGQNKTFLFTGRFGNVYPRIGSLIQNDSYKASAVFAQRAADIVTDTTSMHIYSYLGNPNNRDGFWPPGKIQEWTSKDGKWQQLYPFKDSNCHIFGAPETRESTLVFDGYKPRRSNDGDYAFQFWRPYECCEKKGQVFLYSIDFE